MKNFLKIFVFFSSIISIIFSLEDLYNNDGYLLMTLMPAVYAIIYIFFIHESIFQYKSIVALSYFLISYLRFIIIPILISVTNTYGIEYIIVMKEEYYYIAFCLMLYELIFTSIVLRLSTQYFLKGNSINFFTSQKKLRLTGSKWIYFGFLMFAFLLYLIYPGAKDLLSFLVIQSEQGIRLDERIETNLMLIRQILIVACILAYIVVLSYLIKRYKITNKNLYVIFAVGISLLNISIIVGERRSVQIYTAFVCIFILGTLFEKYKKRIYLVIGTGAALILIGMSIYKHLNAFLYDSYWEALTNSSGTGWGIANTFQAYFFGPQNLAIAVEIAKQVENPISRFIFDFFRSTIGFNFFVKGIDITSSDVFNSYIYGEFKPSGHVISSTGHVYLYFGFLLAPILVALTIVLGTYMEKKLKNTISLELSYLYGYILIRMCVSMFANLPAVINTVSLMLFSLGLIYFVSRIFQRFSEGSKI